MIINHNNDNHIKFVSYTGKYPNLCRGILTLNIDGEDVKFGHDYSIFDSWKSDGNYDEFWTSGGSCGFTNDYIDSYVDHSEWIIDAELLPDKYKKYAAEIDYIFNSNVSHGCCGGCL